MYVTNVGFASVEGLSLPKTHVSTFWQVRTAIIGQVASRIDGDSRWTAYERLLARRAARQS